MKIRIASQAILLSVFLIATNTFAAQFNFTPRVSATSEYTDNLNLTKDDKEDDIITNVSAGFTASLLGRTSGLEVSADPGYVFYRDASENDTWRLPAALSAWMSPSKATRLEFRNDFLRTEDPIAQDRFFAERGRVEETGDSTIRRGRETYYRNTARFDADYRFGEDDRVYAGFVYGLLRNDDEQVEDNDNYTPSLGLDYWFTNRFGTEFYGAYTRGEFDQQSDFLGEPSSDFDNWLGSLRLRGRISRHFSLFFQYDQVYRKFTSGDDNNYYIYAPSAGFTYDIAEDIYSRLGLGYFYQEIKNESDQDNIFLNGEISKDWIFRRGNLNLTGLAGLTQNDFGAQNIGFQQFAAIQSAGTYNFARRLAGDINAYYRFGLTPAGEDDADDDDLTTHQFQVNLGLSYLPFKWMSLRLGYAFNKYISSGDDDYTENRALLTLTLQPDRPWRF